MRRSIWWLLKLTIVVIVAVWLVQQQGQVIIQWHDQEMIFTSLAGFFGVLFAIFLAVYMFIGIWKFIATIPKKMQDRSQAARLRKGLQGLVKTETAFALQDWSQMLGFAQALGRYLDNSAICEAMTAKAALFSGDFDTAYRHLKDLEKSSSGRALANIGHAHIALKNKEWLTAYNFLSDLLKEFPKSPWLLTSLFDVCVKLDKYDQAADLAVRLARRDIITVAEAKQRQAMLYFEKAHAIGTAITMSDKIDLLDKAHALAPSYIPAAIKLAKVLKVEDHPRRAKKVLERTWELSPHPDLAKAYLSLSPNTTAAKELAQIERLHKLTPTHPESLLVCAQAAINAKQWGKAHAALHELEKDNNLTVSACQLMAELELGEKGNEALYRQWLERAVKAKADARWICSQCHSPHDSLQAVCDECQGFDQIRWAA